MGSYRVINMGVDKAGVGYPKPYGPYESQSHELPPVLPHGINGLGTI